MSQLPLFVFGTLRQGECNHHYLVGAFDRVQPATLRAFCRIEPLILKQATAIANLSLLRAHTPSVSDVVGDECWAVELSVSEAFGSQNQ
ncbi:MAG: gamma-glutamylcyclotransferase, partial [Planctomycetia bacterium]|nr:gamma-glutamylcyclotransferase [Planctomycetia bacterium]